MIIPDLKSSIVISGPYYYMPDMPKKKSVDYEVKQSAREAAKGAGGEE